MVYSRWFASKQVRLNKDASEVRDEDEIAARDLPDLSAGCLLQIVCRFIAARLQFKNCRLFAI